MNICPALFVGHGSPTNAIEDNEFSREWEKLGTELPKPDAIVCVSAHWVTQGSFVTAMDEPRTIHDFYGFPEELYQVQYPAPGNPLLASQIYNITKNVVRPEQNWGLDHGTWSVLKRMFPDAEIPVIQISLDANLQPSQHFALAQQLKELRQNNIMIIGSGNIVHNLHMIKWADESYPWADRFDKEIKDSIKDRNFEKVINYKNLGDAAKMSVPSDEHFLPLLYILGVTNPESQLRFFCEKVTLGAISMTSLLVEG
jgi:4,5-DOPA dioxygenase extradiol